MELKNLIVMLMFLLVVASIASAAEIIYVDDDASAGGDGSSWDTAFKYLQDGLAAAVSGDEIHVAQGTYQPDRDEGNPTGTGIREAAFRLISGVAVYGGYGGDGEPDPDAWDVSLYETILSGDLANDDDSVGDNSENSYHVTVCIGTDTNTVLDGLTVTAGNADSSSWPNNCGGGMYCTGTLTLTNVTFIGNSANNVSGMYNNGGNLTLIHCTFSSNSARGMSNDDGRATLIDCKFIGNTTGMSNNYSDLTLMNCTFSGNWSGGHGGGMTSHAGSQTLINCTFTGNVSQGEFYGGGGMWIGHQCNSVLINCILWDNVASSSGPQIAMDGCTLSVSYSNIQGGAIDISGYGSLNWLDGNIGEDPVNDDPLFVDPGYWDMSTWFDGDYHLKSTAGKWDPNSEIWVTDDVNSPCIDVGDPNSDWTAELWPHGKRINMGAYGGTPQASMSESPAGNIADLDANDVVNYSDLDLFTEGWLRQQVLLSEDLDRDGLVNSKDFAIFANNWLWEE